MTYNETLSYKQWSKYTVDKGKEIPKIIFRTANFEMHSLPKEIKEVLEESSKMNNEYQEIYLSDQDCISFLTEFYPEYLPLYLSLIPGAFKADIIRLLLLYKYGGVYNDIGHTYMTPITNIIFPEDELVFIIESDNTMPFALHNAFMAVYPKHPIIHRMIEEVTQNERNKHYGINALDVTGPMAIGRAFNKFFEQDEVNPMIQGFHTENGHKIKLLKTIVENIQFILDVYGNKIIRTKFSNYYQIMYYNQNSKRYGEFWNNRNIYV